MAAFRALLPSAIYHGGDLFWSDRKELRKLFLPAELIPDLLVKNATENDLIKKLIEEVLGKRDGPLPDGRNRPGYITLDFGYFGRQSNQIVGRE